MKWSEWPGYRAGHRWSRTCAVTGAGGEVEPAYTRPLGLLESGFDVGGQRQGQSDIHALLKVDLPPPPGGGAGDKNGEVNDRNSLQLQLQWSNRFAERVLLAWTTVRNRHPLLASYVRDGEHACMPGVPAREFVYVPPTSSGTAVLAARDTVLLHECGAEETLDEACLAVLDQYILNGERVLLDQSQCLARLVLLRRPDEPLKLGLALVVSHVACDALSAFRVLRELFEEIVAEPMHRGDEATGSEPLHRLDDFLSGHKPGSPRPERAGPGPDSPRWPDAAALRLPLSSEEHYPVIPTSAGPGRDESPSRARQRWFWAFKRTVLLRRQEQYPRTLPFPRIPLGAEAPAPPQPRTRWPRLQFDPATSARLFAACRELRVSPSMLLYAMSSMSLARILATSHSAEPYHPVVIGFPFSSRPFADRQPAQHAGCLPSNSDPLVDVALRITFSQIHLPSIPLDPRNPENSTQIRWQALQSARLAKRQFVRMLEPEALARDLLHAEAYGRILDRVLTMGGDNPVAYKRIPTSMNASMIGDLDRMFPSEYASPPPVPDRRRSAEPTVGDASESAVEADHSFRLQLHDLRFGTRLHRGEGMLMEAFTWQGRLTVCLGVDDELLRPEDVDALLEGIERTGRIVAFPP
ncbi:hypothetical protein JCM3774_001015 [Rhodotorula dairenensis]